MLQCAVGQGKKGAGSQVARGGLLLAVRLWGCHGEAAGEPTCRQHPQVSALFRVQGEVTLILSPANSPSLKSKFNTQHWERQNERKSQLLKQDCSLAHSAELGRWMAFHQTDTHAKVI